MDTITRHLDIMTSNAGRLTPDGTRVSLPKPEPPDGEPSPTNSEVNPVAIEHTLHWNGGSHGLHRRGVRGGRQARSHPGAASGPQRSHRRQGPAQNLLAETGEPLRGPGQWGP